MRRRTAELVKWLRGGERRSLGQSARAVETVRACPARFSELFSCLYDEDPIVQLRAADAVEKVTRVSPRLLRPWKSQVFDLCEASKATEVRWHLAQMLPRIVFSGAERERAVMMLEGFLQDRSSIVKTMALQALFDLSQKDAEMRLDVLARLEHAAANGSPAVRARARKLLAVGRIP